MESQSQSAQIPAHVLDYLQGQRTLTLATVSSDGEPHAATMLYVNDGGRVYIWSKGGSTTSANLQASSRVSFAIDEYTDDFRQAKGIQAVGEASPVSGEEMATVAALFGDRFPDLSTGGSTASIAFYRLDPTHLHFIDNSGAEKQAEEFGIDYHRERVFTSTELPAQGSS